MALQVDARPGQRDAAHLEDERVLRELQCDVRILLDDEHGEALALVQLLDDAEDLGDQQGREPERRLVQQE